MISTCAIVGANGFLGKKLTQKLSEKGFSVTAVYNTSFSNIDTEINKMSIIDFVNTKNQYNFVILSLGNYQCSHKELIEINETIYKIQQNNEKAKIIFISSTNVYGIHEDMISIHSSYNSPALYPFSKLAGEFLISAHEKYAILRFTYLYGKGLNNKSFLPNIIEKSESTGEIVLFGDGSRKQDYLHVDDAAELCIKAMNTSENGVFLGASGISVSNYEVAKIISVKHNSKISFTGSESGSSFFFNIDETKEKLNWKPQVDIENGIREML
jgi:nucleoside-diphosphate-sugar epimerase